MAEDDLRNIVKQIFTEYDKDGSGTLDAVEGEAFYNGTFYPAMHAVLGDKLKPFATWFAEVDDDHDGTIS